MRPKMILTRMLVRPQIASDPRTLSSSPSTALGGGLMGKRAEDKAQGGRAEEGPKGGRA